MTHRPCVGLALCLISGILLGRYWTWAWYDWALASGLMLCLTLLVPRKFSCLMLYATALCLGALVLQRQYVFDDDHIAFLSYEDRLRVQSVEGVVDSDVQIKSGAYASKHVFELKLKRICLETGCKDVQGRVLVNLYQDLPVQYADHLRLQGHLQKALQRQGNSFSYQQYLEDHGLFFIFITGKSKQISWLSHGDLHSWLAWCLWVKHCFKDIIARYFDPKEAGMIQAMLLGDRSCLTKQEYDLFSQTGTAHILAISGMNMAIIAAIFIFIFRLIGLPLKFQLALTALVLLFYAVLSGWSASVVRSVIMACILLGSFFLEYEADSANSLAIAAIVLLLIDPMNLFDLGFQLSFLCVLALIVYYPIMHAWVVKRVASKAASYLLEAMLISLIAWLSTVMLIAYEFHRVSLIAILANMIIVPLADMIVALSLIMVLCGMLFPVLAVALAGCLKVLLNGSLWLIVLLAKIPLASFYTNSIQLQHILAYYVIILIATTAIIYVKKGAK